MRRGSILPGYVNSQNTRVWFAKNPHTDHETHLHIVKIGVWCALSHRRTAGSIFLENTINSESCIDMVHEVLGHFNEKEIVKAWFQQDSTTCYRVRVIVHGISQ
jgi:hypothetical protein